MALAVLVHTSDHPFVELSVDHLERRSASAQGTMWGAQRGPLIPPRLVVFSVRAAGETLRQAPAFRRGRPTR